ncbi:hypothetical protein H310_05398 [Aphanomyces invadans]|uniref:SGNH hydrolase-type esterase domain-containing protein n=1 Tax=Aphanomyces invadans TaxID=157072 RepID=A0A024U976_9STRA|nr:hypothetical protein H310_05398 [Aphanomyces invadans]ETW02956.1 hypothetical protein H310_05398 [Aphanomyces invadans]|eukprot:XP_008868340.1 hypothetical protein H310_05398 [Aphanomyces invadans]
MATSETSATTALATHPSILLLGDSITEQACNPTTDGFHSLLARDYIRRFDVVNRGLSGYTTTWMLDLLPTILRDAYAHRSPPHLVTLFLGANDAATDDSPQHVPLAVFEANLRAIVAMLHQWFPSTKVLLITPPPVSDSNPFGRENDVTGRYAAATVAVGNELAVPVLDVWALFQAEKDSYLSDGLHLNAKGNFAVYTALTKHIAHHWPDLSADRAPFAYPTWRTIAKV